MKLCLIFILSFVFVNYFYSQGTATQNAVNQYVGYINHCNFYASSSHYSIKNFNIAIVKRFERPQDYSLNKQLFKDGECMTVNLLLCEEKLDQSKIQSEYQNLVQTISNLPNPEKVELQSSLQSYQDAFNLIVASVNDFKVLKTDKEFYSNEIKRTLFYERLDEYKKRVEGLAKATEFATILNKELFGEQDLPFDIERSRKVVLTIKSILNGYLKNDTALIDSQFQEFSKVSNYFHYPKFDIETRKRQLNEWGYNDYFGYEHGTKQLYLSGQSKHSILDWVQKYRNPSVMDLKYPDSGLQLIFDKRKLKDESIHVHYHQVEYLFLRLNDLDGGPIHKYNNFITKASKPILKITEEVLPYHPIKINIDEEDLIFDQSNSFSLDGAKINNLVLLLDVSGSMSQNGKMKRLKSSISHLVNILREEDKLTVITYSGVPKVIFETKGNSNRFELLSKINRMQSSGRTNFEEGLTLAYSFSEKNWVSGGSNKIIIATDGGFKLSKNQKKKIKSKSTEGFVISSFHYLTTLNSTKGSKVLMKIAKEGKGNYVSLFDDDEALKALIKEAKIPRD